MYANYILPIRGRNSLHICTQYILAIINNRLLILKDAYALRTKKSQRDSVSGWSEVWLKCTFTRASSSDELHTFEPESSIQFQ